MWAVIKGRQIWALFIKHEWAVEWRDVYVPEGEIAFWDVLKVLDTL